MCCDVSTMEMSGGEVWLKESMWGNGVIFNRHHVNLKVDNVERINLRVTGRKHD